MKKVEAFVQNAQKIAPLGLVRKSTNFKILLAFSLIIVYNGHKVNMGSLKILK